MTLASRSSDNLYRPHFSSFYSSNSTTSNYMGSKAREPFRMQLFCIMLHASSLCASFVVRIHLLQHDRHYTWRALPYTVRHPVFHLSLVISSRLVANNSSPHLPYQSPRGNLLFGLRHVAPHHSVPGACTGEDSSPPDGN